MGELFCQIFAYFEKIYLIQYVMNGPSCDDPCGLTTTDTNGTHITLLKAKLDDMAKLAGAEGR